jgi:hypothetical protein
MTILLKDYLKAKGKQQQYIQETGQFLNKSFVSRAKIIFIHFQDVLTSQNPKTVPESMHSYCILFEFTCVCNQCLIDFLPFSCAYNTFLLILAWSRSQSLLTPAYRKCVVKCRVEDVEVLVQPSQVTAPVSLKQHVTNQHEV